MSDISSSWTSHLSEVPTHCLEAEVERRRLADLPPEPEPDPSRPAYRVTIDVLSLNGDVDTVRDLIQTFESLRHSEFLDVIEVRRKDLPGWDDDHPMNHEVTAATARDEWFKDAPVVWRRRDQ